MYIHHSEYSAEVTRGRWKRGRAIEGAKYLFFSYGQMMIHSAAQAF